jgi:glyoxylate reductase
MSVPPVLVTRRLADEVIETLKARCDLTVHREPRPMTREELLAAVAGKAGILMTILDRVDDELLDAAGPGLRVVSNYGVGYDHIDVPACTARGVTVTNTPGVLTEATADIAWALILAASRRIAEGDRLVRSRRPWGWSPDFMLGREVHGKTLGIVGMGRIGRAVASRATAFGMRILYTSHGRHDDVERELGAESRPLEGLLSEADVVSVHVPLTAETRRLFGRAEFARMLPTAVFVNTSRGPVVEEQALADALRAGEIFAAGLDVYEDEPNVNDDLRACDNVVLVPHLGSATVETRTSMGMLAAENLIRVLSHQSGAHTVNPL